MKKAMIWLKIQFKDDVWFNSTNQNASWDTTALPKLQDRWAVHIYLIAF